MTEFGDITDDFLLINSATEHAHNVFVCAIVHNGTRDMPDAGPAAWVSAASDKSGAQSSKAVVAGDAGEQRLKMEVMSLTARDRRRIKAATSDKPDEDGWIPQRNGYEEFLQASRIKLPENVPASVGIGKNWDLEIRKRYAQPLFAETLEFPDVAAIQARMEPICYEESVTGGASAHCAELVLIASEIFVKEIIGTAFSRTRSNGPQYGNGAGMTIMTGTYKRQVRKEEAEVRSGKLERVREDDLLPVESREANTRRPLSVADLKLAGRVAEGLWNGMPLVSAQVMESASEAEQEEWYADRTRGESRLLNSNGEQAESGDDIMDMDDETYEWEGTAIGDREALGSLLRDCLSIR